MKTNILTKNILGAAAAGLMSLSANAYEIDLTGLGFVEYGDGLSYSMPIANYQFGFATNNGPYAIPSTPGAIKDLIVVATGAEGGPVTTNGAGFDYAYSTPSGVSGSTYFSAEGGTDRGSEGPIANNLENTWDANVSSLMNFLNGEAMVFFFNNNNINSGDSTLQSLAAWAQIWITDSTGALVGSVFEFSNNSATDGSSVGNLYAPVTEGGGGEFGGDPTLFTATNSGTPGLGPVNTDYPNETDYVLAGGEICVATGGILPVPVPVPCGSDPALVGGDTISAPINHNLGADHVAYTIIFPELNALLASLGGDLSQYTMHVDIRLGCDAGAAGDPAGVNEDFFMDCGAETGWGDALNNGYEQIFIGRAFVPEEPPCPPTDPNYPTCEPPEVPEPNSLAIIGLGLVLMGWVGYSRRRRAYVKTL